MEDWVELMHQWGMRQRRRLRTVKDPYVRAKARERALHRDTNPEVVAHSTEVKSKTERNMKEPKVLKETKKREERVKNRMAALAAYELSKMPVDDVGIVVEGQQDMCQ